jgi:beta-glucuronidase
MSDAEFVQEFERIHENSTSEKYNRISLNRMWDFTFEDGSKTILPVPGCFDASDPYRFRKGKGSYACKVNGSGMMELTCDGLGLRADIFWDDRKIYSELSAYTPLKIRFDAGVDGEHELKIVCDNTIEDTPESEFRSFYDFYGFGGIYREITLRKLPDTTFDYVAIVPDIEQQTINLHVELFGKEREVTVRIDDEVCGKLPGSGDGIFQVPMPTLWSPESPHLHCLHLDCGCDHYECRFGLRKIESRDGSIFLNGQPLKIIGVNRHDVFPDTGAAVSRERIYHDLQMIKCRIQYDKGISLSAKSDDA